MMPDRPNSVRAPLELRGERVLLAAPALTDVDRIAELCRWEGVSRSAASQRGFLRDDWRAGILAGDPRVPAPGWPEFTFVQEAL